MSCNYQRLELPRYCIFTSVSAFYQSVYIRDLLSNICFLADFLPIYNINISSGEPYQRDTEQLESVQANTLIQNDLRSSLVNVKVQLADLPNWSNARGEGVKMFDGQSL